MGGGDGAAPVEGGGEEREAVPAPALTGSMVIEGGGDFPDDEPNFNREGGAPVSSVDRPHGDRPHGGDRGGRGGRPGGGGGRDRGRGGRGGQARWRWTGSRRTRRSGRGKTLRTFCHGFEQERPRCESWPFFRGTILSGVAFGLQQKQVPHSACSLVWNDIC